MARQGREGNVTTASEKTWRAPPPPLDGVWLLTDFLELNDVKRKDSIVARLASQTVINFAKKLHLSKAQWNPALGNSNYSPILFLI